MPLRRSEIHHQTDGKGLPELNVEGPMDQWQVTKEEPWVDGQGRERVTRTFEPVRRPGEPSREAIPCHTCGKPATCFGSYEHPDNFGAGCDECCGHGNEDGWCKPIAEIADDFAALRTERDVIKIEYESRVLWIEKMNKILGYDNSDGFHSRPDPSEIATALRSELQAAHEALRVLQDLSGSNNTENPWLGVCASMALRVNRLKERDEQLQAAREQVKQMQELFDPNHLLFNKEIG